MVRRKGQVNEMTMNITNHDWELLQAIWDYLLVEDELPAKADAIVVGGAALVTDMAQRAAEIYGDGVANKIVVSGFTAPSAKMNESEAMLLKKVLLANGVAPEDVLVDERASNTGANIINSAELIHQAGIEVHTVILVHKPFMTRRFLATAEVAWPEPRPQFFVTSTAMSMKDYYRLHHQAYPDDPLRMIRSMLGDYERIKVYPAKGFLVQQPASLEADVAWDELMKRGFTKRGIK